MKMTSCKICGKVFGNIQQEAYVTTLNNEPVYACLSCYQKQCAVINSEYDRDEHYTKESDLSQDVIDRLKAINYPISKFLKEVVYNDENSLKEWLHCMESNAHKQPKEHQDLLDKTKSVEHHPSLNEYQRKRIEGYLKAGLSLRSIVKACKADNFNVSKETVQRIKKEMKNNES
jgi:hypothetical protein